MTVTSQLDTWVMLAVLLAAVLHASWNAFLKASVDRLITFAWFDVTALVIAGVAVAFVGVPARESWPYIAASVIVHVFYRVFLMQAYRYGDLSSSYPIARGSAPLLVAGAALAMGLAEPRWAMLVGVGLISAGVMSLAFSRAYRLRRLDRGVAYALATGLVIAVYSIIDAEGVRLSGEPLGYIFWLFLLDSLPMPLYVIAARRDVGLRHVLGLGLGGFVAGALAMAAYGIVIWAFSRGGVAEIVALRETSVVFGALIGAILLKEGLGPRRIAAAIVVAAGIIVLKIF